MMGAEPGPDIVLVDDDNDLRHALVQGLELDGYAVADFPRADAALSMITRAFAVHACRYAATATPADLPR